MPGPLPTANPQRTNGPTIAGAELPAAGRTERAPTLPPGFKNLGKVGRAWWRYAWQLPQATKWDAGTVHTAARRARLEDRLAALSDETPFDPLENLIADLVDADSDHERISTAIRDLKAGFHALKAIAGGEVAIMKEIRELDGKLGLNPKAMADLRWRIVETEQSESDTLDEAVARMDDYRARLG